MAVALGGAVALYGIVKVAVGRARPAMGLWIGHYSRHAFSSGHATQSIAFYGMRLVNGRSITQAPLAFVEVLGMSGLIVGSTN